MTPLDPNGIKAAGATMSGMGDELPMRAIAWRTAAWMTLLLGAWLGWGASIGNPMWFALAGAPVGSALGAISFALAHIRWGSERLRHPLQISPDGPCAVCNHEHPDHGGSCEGEMKIAGTWQRCPCYRHFAPLPTGSLR